MARYKRGLYDLETPEDVYEYCFAMRAVQAHIDRGLKELEEYWGSASFVSIFMNGVCRAMKEKDFDILEPEVYLLGKIIKEPQYKSYPVMELLGYQSAVGLINFLRERGN